MKQIQIKLVVVYCPSLAAFGHRPRVLIQRSLFHIVLCLFSLNLIGNLCEKTISNVFECLNIVTYLTDRTINHRKRLKGEIPSFIFQNAHDFSTVAKVFFLVLLLG